MIGNQFAFSAAISDFSYIKNLKTQCDCTNVMEISGVLEIADINFNEPGVLHISGKFGDIDISVHDTQLEQLAELLLKGDKNENKQKK